MANINRDYLIIADLKSGKITSPNMSFYNTDKNIANLFVKLQITMSTNPSITGFVNKEEASNYNVKLTVIKPKTTMLVDLVGVVQDESVMGNGAVYLFDMPQNFTDQVGKYVCELEITCMVNGREEVVTCDPFEYVVKESAVTGLNGEIEPNPDIPVLKQLIDEVRYLQENGGSVVNLSKYQKMEDDKLNTTNKTIVGGINELNTQCLDIKQNKANKSEVDENLSQINQSNIERDKKIFSIENINSVQNAKLDTLFNSASGEMELESNSNNIKLDSSKKGTATVNYIKGNTLVNCAKENKELILNDEINVEGTHCTINDTVEGGLVDVELEGLSLNNLANKQVDYFPSGDATDGVDSVVITENASILCYEYEVEPNTTYTILKLTITDRGNICLFENNNIGAQASSVYISALNTINNPFTFTTKANEKCMLVYVATEKSTSPKADIILLKGDYTNKPLPKEAFTGIKSVGEEVTLTNLGGTIIPTKSDGAGELSNIDDVYKLFKRSDVSYLKFNLSNTSNFIGKTITIKVDKLKISYNTYVETRIYNRTNPSNSTPLVTITEDKQYFVANIPSTVQSIDSLELLLYVKGTRDIDWIEVSNKITIVEGDYSNSNLEYFEGSIKKYKIETFSQNKNLFDLNEVKINLMNTPVEYVTYQDKNCISATNHFSSKWIDSFKFKPNTQYKLTYSVYYENALNERKRGIYLRFVYTDGTTSSVNMPDTNVWKTITLISDEGKTVKCIDNSWGYPVSETKTYIDLDTLSLTEGIESVPYVKHQQYKKVILLDEPLRGIEGKSKDITTKIENKSYEKRVCSEVVLNGNENWTKYGDLGKCLCFYYKLPNQHGGSYTFINDKLKSIHSFDDTDHIHINDTGLHITIEKTKLETQDVDGFKKWLQANPVTVVYQLATPVYEEIKDLNNEYPTYAEVTHISTNTVIPCNQKIQNTGIECMLKPSTLYSIHDIRTGSGTAKYNLGGTVNTSNKVTTGATLTDNYLRLYGKGLTSRDVEVFEGDTPQTPYFSGMLSAFEDKKITQEMVDSGLEKTENLGKYRAILKVVGKNKFDGKIELGSLTTDGKPSVHDNAIRSVNCIEVESKKAYIISSDLNYSFIIYFYDKLYNNIGVVQKNSFTTPSNCCYIKFRSTASNVENNLNVKVQLEEGTQATSYEPYKEYKTSILLGSPSLKGDEICVQNGMLGHSHNYEYIHHNQFDIKSEQTSIAGNFRWILYRNPKVANSELKTSILAMCNNYNTIEPYRTWGCTGEGVSQNSSSNMILIYLDKYKDGSELSKQALIKEFEENKTVIAYKLAEPYFEPLTPQLPRWILDIFDNSTISIDTIIPVESKFTYTSYIPSIPAMQTNIKGLEEANVDIIATSWDTDFRVCEIEWVLEDAGLTTPISLNNIKTGGNVMALTRFEQAKIIILGDAYYRPTFQKQLETYLKRNYLTQEEFDTLISMMDAKEAIKGEII